MWTSSAALAVTPETRRELERLVRSGKTEQRIALRARIVLGAADGKSNNALARELNTSRPTVIDWRRRFAEGGVKALDDDRPRGRSFQPLARAKEAEIIARTQSAPQHATQWSCRSMARACGVSKASVQRIWHANGLKPHLLKTFKLSNDPDFIEKLEDVVGLYMNPPEHALVFCIDEKSQIQALDRTQPGLPMKKGRAGTMTHDYKRNGTTTLFAALDVLKGEVIGRCMPRHRHQEFLKFLKADRPQHAEASGHPLHCRQLRDPQKTGSQGLARQAPALSPPLHSDIVIMAEPGRALVRQDHHRADPPRGVSQACRNSNAPSMITSNTTMPTRSLSSGQNPRTTSSSKSIAAGRLCKCRLCRATCDCKPLRETLH